MHPTPAIFRTAVAAVALLFSGIAVSGLAAPAAAAAPGALERALAPRDSALRIDGRTVDARALRSYYAARGFAPVWTGADGALNARGRTLAGLLPAAAVTEGLDPSAYRPDGPASPAAGGLPAEIRVAAALLSYARDVGTGRPHVRRADPDLFVSERTIDADAILARAERAADLAAFVASLAPTAAPYVTLRNALAAYRQVQSAGGWTVLNATETLKPGATGSVLETLRERLRITGDLAPEADFTGALEGDLLDAVRRFQERHGLTADGIVGPRTRNALNAPVAERIAQIGINMERWRWIGDDLGESHVFVNLAGFELTAVRRGSTRLRMAVIVGKSYRRTPVFSDMIQYMEFNPVWSVPYRIASEDILPKLQQNPAYLVENGFTLLPPAGDQGRPVPAPETIDWSDFRADHFPFRLRQAPGPKNALGTVKFMFPNRFAVYLHDTSDRSLFAREVRNFSSGCIRVADPVALAVFVMNNDEWTEARVRAEIETGKTRVVRPAKPVPVHLAYLTAWAGPDGRTHFREDIYGRDKLLAKALISGR